MRIDARNLLDRLGRNEFAYREFEDRFSELELWPMLEALLRDPRLQKLDEADESAAAEAAAVEAVPVREERPAEAISSLFARYDERGGGEAAQQRRSASAGSHDVREMLRHLSDLGARGEI